MSTVKIICKNCNKDMEIKSKEYNRQIKNGRSPDMFFCGLSCSSSYNNKNNPLMINNIKKLNTYPKTIKRNRKQSYRYFMANMLKRGLEIGVDTEYLESLWNEQDGKCALSGLDMEVRTRTLRPHNNYLVASLDRIDSSKGYVVGNVQFVCYALNLAKQSGSDSDFRDFLTLLKKS